MEDDNPTSDITTAREALVRHLFSEALVFHEFPELNESSVFALPETREFNDLAFEVITPLERQPATSRAHSGTPLKYTPIQIVIGDDQEIDAEQPSTSSSLISSQTELLVQDAKVYSRIRELREAGLWGSTRLPKCEDPPRRKTHWDFLLEEIGWLANDFKAERKYKRKMARQLAFNAKAHWRRRIESRSEPAAFTRDEREAKRVCSSIARMIREFWQNVDKIVDFRANEIVESKKRKALDQHLNFLVGAADKITSIIQERLADSPNHRSSTRNSVAEEQHSDDYDNAEISEDDESTLDQEEADRPKAHVDQELDDLYKERDMDIDQLLTSLPAGYLDYLGYNEQQVEPESSQVDSMDDEQTRTTTGAGEADAIANDKPDLQNVDYTKLTSKDSEVRRQQLDNIAEAALEFQPRGYTLETTEVKTDTPFLLRGELREYQLVGLDWLVTLYEKNLNGILADEMGLGKTIQTIALLAHLACARAVWGPHLIIVPTSVILNWEMELKKWCPSLKVLTYFGTAKERADKRKGWAKSNAFHVCITSYKLATQDIRAFKKKAWQYLILDEAQNIKNFKSQRWQLLLGLRSRRRLLLTGTPLQNSLMELWALLHFLMPSVFASHDDFKEWFHCPITGMVEGTSELDLVLIQRLHKVLRPFILRRLKSEVEKQLPTKTEKIIPCSLSKRQRYLYNEFLSKRSTVENLRSGNMLSVLGVIMQLRKCCNHPNLFEPRPVVSPFVAPPIAPQFPLMAFSIDSVGLDQQRTAELSLLNLYSSRTVWELFSTLSTPENLHQELKKRQNREEAVLLFADESKFVLDGSGGHFFKVYNFHSQQHTEEHSLCNGDHPTQFTVEFVNNTRKRKLPAVCSAMDEANDQPEPDQPEPSEDIGNLFQTARREIFKGEEERILQNQKIALWRTQRKRLCGAPKFSPELTSFVSRSRGFNLVERINEQIAQNMLEWLEASLNRFVLCVLNLLPNRPLEMPMPNAYAAYEHQLYNLRSAEIYSAQSTLFHKAEISSRLEFPELRLIEYDCGKLQVISKLLKQLHENKHRCLIFTQMSRMLDILQAFLSYHNYKYFRLDGSTHIDQRQAMMERFNADDSIFCFILSTRSGGIGVNLTGADTVIFYDSDWNPTMDAQAQDRCHRIGQTRNVTIYRLISERTIEENILTKSMQKKRLGEMAIDEGEFTPDFFKSATNLRELFSNEETVADIIAPVRNEPQNTRDIETAMQSVEDQQDVIAAQKAKEETRADSAEFDENVAAADPSTDHRNIESPSDQYMELINGLKPVERYAVNFLANEYRPALDKEFKETEALLKAKQKELMGGHGQESMSESDGEEQQQQQDADSLDIAYDANSPSEKLSIFGTLDIPFEEIPSWMPPSPPNSAAGKSPSQFYQPIDGTFLYEPISMTEERLPPLPPLISLSEVPPRIRPRQRKLMMAAAGIPFTGKLSLLSAQQKRKRTHSGTTKMGKIPREKGGGQHRAERKERDQQQQQRQADIAMPSTTSALISPPNTPLPAVGGKLVEPIPLQTLASMEMPQPREERIPQSQAVAAVPKPSSLSSLDESIESTVRKNRKLLGPSRYIIRNTGLPPQLPVERMATEPSRIIFKIIAPAAEWRFGPQHFLESPDYEGPGWTASEDQRILKATVIKHGLSTELMTQSPGLQLNWDFVSQYVNLGSSHFRSARQCALRYQNYLLRCDGGHPVSSSSASAGTSRRQRTAGAAPPHSVILDTNYCTQEAANLVKKRASLMAEATHQRRRLMDQQPPPHQPQQTPQLLCLTGRLPPQHEQRLLELGARYTNVVRPTDILGLRRDRSRRQMAPAPPPQQHP